MTEETVDCFNCGRANPEWAQVCRSCGVALRHGQARIVPTGRMPTDRDSVVSIVAVIGTIVLAVFLGLFASSLNPTDGGVGAATPTPTATERPTPTEAPSESAIVTPSIAVSPTPTPLPATVVFGTTLGGDQQVTDPQETFTPGMRFAHSISSTVPFGSDVIAEQVMRLNEDGTDNEEVVAAAGNQLAVDPAATVVGYVGPDAGDFVRSWGPGLYEMRVFIGETMIARGSFRLAEG